MFDGKCPLCSKDLENCVCSDGRRFSHSYSTKSTGVLKVDLNMSKFFRLVFLFVAIPICTFTFWRYCLYTFETITKMNVLKKISSESPVLLDKLITVLERSTDKTVDVKKK